MEYEDELDRMRQRRRRKKAEGETGTGRRKAGSAMESQNTERRRRRPQEARREDERYSRERSFASRRPECRGAGRRPGAYEDRDYEDRRYGRRQREYGGRYDDEYGDYDEYDEYDEYDRYGGYDDYEDPDNYDEEYYDDEYDQEYRAPYSGRRAGGPDRDRRRGAGQGRGRTGQGPEDTEDRSKGRGKADKHPKKKKHRFLMLLLLLILLAAGYFVYKYKQTGSGYWTVAVFGVDSRNGNLEKGALSDVEMICVIDRGTGEIKLVSVYRDTYLEINPDGTYHKINEAYFKGGHEQAVEALERNLDLSVDDYATFNWKAVVDAINILGGVDIEISDSEFQYINSFITETVESTGIGSHHLEHAGMNHLDGIQAVAYARLRLMDTDYNRTARQRLVIQLAMNKAKEVDLKTLTALVQTVIPQISTSISVDDILPIARNIKKFHISQNGGFPFSRGETYVGKKDCVIPLTLESNVIQLHQLLYGTENFQPSETVRQISARIASDSGMGEVAENAPEAKVLGQRALEGGGSGSGSLSGGSAGNTPDTGAPAQQPEAAPAQTEPAQNQDPVPESSQESMPEESSEETSPEDVSQSPEESASSEPASSEPEFGYVQPSQGNEPGPGNPGQTEPEVGPAFTQPAETQPTASAEETTAEIGPGVS